MLELKAEKNGAKYFHQILIQKQSNLNAEFIGVDEEIWKTDKNKLWNIVSADAILKIGCWMIAIAVYDYLL